MQIVRLNLNPLIDKGTNYKTLQNNDWTYSEAIKSIQSKKVYGLFFHPNKKRALILENKYTESFDFKDAHNVNVVDYQTLSEIAIDNDVIVDMYADNTQQIPWFQIIIALTIIGSIISNRRPMMFPFSNDKLDIVTSDVTFNDVIGCDESKYELSEIVSILKNPLDYKDIQVPRGVLLEGPPGTGKTLMAKALAGEADVPFISLSGSEFIQVFAGLGANKVRNAFKKARELAPCIIFIDEIDAIAKSRMKLQNIQGGGNDEREQTLNQLLIEMDGFKDRVDVIVVASTNRVDTLDKAILRPGRFDRKVLVPLPDQDGRLQLLEYYTKNKELHHVDLEALSQISEGFSGADIKNLVNEAAIYAIRTLRPSIDESCFYYAFEKKVVGLSKSVETRDKTVLKQIAMHEAGHAYMVKHFENFFDLRLVTVNQNLGGAGGYTLYTTKKQYLDLPTKEFLLAKICTMLGGRVIEYLINHKTDNKSDMPDMLVSAGSAQDLQQANQLAKQMVEQYGFGTMSKLNTTNMSDSKKETIENDIQDILDHCTFTTVNVLSENYLNVEHLAMELMRKTTLSSINHLFY